jgi:hypothetical protein
MARSLSREFFAARKKRPSEVGRVELALPELSRGWIYYRRRRANWNCVAETARPYSRSITPAGQNVHQQERIQQPCVR